MGRSVRLLRRGDVVATENGEQVIGEVQVVVRYANGETISYPSVEEVEIVEPENLSELEDGVRQIAEEDAEPQFAPEEIPKREKLARPGDPEFEDELSDTRSSS